ncbi:alpha/beta fold hydrolase [Streptantibioticus ferralitis]|uniref:Alpha/beta hydrolase n=1 Tax=Streptantibioticus ferralitis TaxID=236510 RepID=A0ABT5YZ58_9ACTN|nr:alpha/beta hydrolase [Streptantibioticus ferralitis]MDF2256798.1 alpha/beta hydrolase [Streptantibioticus ferralitis]
MAMIRTADGPDGITLHVQRLAPPDGRPPTATAVLLHGLLTDSLASYYFTVAPALAAAGIDVVMYDHRGHGRSERPCADYRLADFVRDLERLLDRLEITGPVHLVGNCFGGTVAFEYAVRHPDRVAGVSLIESNPATESWAKEIADIFRRLVTELVEHEAEALAWVNANEGGHTARLAKSAARLMRSTSIATDVPASRVLSEEQVRSVHCPVLAVYGSDSELAGQTWRLESLVPGTRSIVLPGQGHSVLAEAPGLVLDLLLSGIREPGGTPPVPVPAEGDAR